MVHLCIMHFRGFSHGPLVVCCIVTCVTRQTTSHLCCKPDSNITFPTRMQWGHQSKWTWIATSVSPWVDPRVVLVAAPEESWITTKSRKRWLWTDLPAAFFLGWLKCWSSECFAEGCTAWMPIGITFRSARNCVLSKLMMALWIRHSVV